MNYKDIFGRKNLKTFRKEYRRKALLLQQTENCKDSKAVKQRKKLANYTVKLRICV